MSAPALGIPASSSLHLITRNVPEVIGLVELTQLVETRMPVVYWGTACTGSIHLAYLLPMLKIADFINAGCNVIIFFADLHAMLDCMKSNEAQLKHRTQYYKIMITSLLVRLGVDVNQLTFVTGSDFQLSPPYMMDVFRANALTTVSQSIHAAADVVKLAKEPPLNGLLYPTLQALDMHYLKADVFFGGVDQRKINVFARELMPKLGYKKGIFLMNEMVPSLSRTARVHRLESFQSRK